MANFKNKIPYRIDETTCHDLALRWKYHWWIYSSVVMVFMFSLSSSHTAAVCCPRECAIPIDVAIFNYANRTILHCSIRPLNHKNYYCMHECWGRFTPGLVQRLQMHHQYKITAKQSSIIVGEAATSHQPNINSSKSRNFICGSGTAGPRWNHLRQ